MVALIQQGFQRRQVHRNDSIAIRTYLSTIPVDIHVYPLVSISTAATP